MSWVVGLPSNSYNAITNTAWVRARLCKLQKRCTRLAAASDNVYQLLAHGRWFSPDTRASSTTKTGRLDIAEILLKVTLKHQKTIKIKYKKTMSVLNQCISKFIRLILTDVIRRISIIILIIKFLLLQTLIYNYGLHEKLISIIITLRKGYFPEVRPRENNPFSM